MFSVRKLTLALSFLLLLAVNVACYENFDKRLQREAREYTENHCPWEPEPGSRLDSTVYSPKNRTYTCYYTLAEANESVFRENTPLLHHFLLNELKENVEYKALKDERINFAYIYRSQTSGRMIYETVLKAEEYLK